MMDSGPVPLAIYRLSVVIGSLGLTFIDEQMASSKANTFLPTSKEVVE